MASVAFVPGLWEDPQVFETVQEQLEASNIPMLATSFVSTGKSSPNNPTMHDGVKAVRSQIEWLVNEEKDMLLVLHSAGR